MIFEKCPKSCTPTALLQFFSILQLTLQSLTKWNLQDYGAICKCYRKTNNNYSHTTYMNHWHCLQGASKILGFYKILFSKESKLQQIIFILFADVFDLIKKLIIQLHSFTPVLCYKIIIRYNLYLCRIVDSLENIWEHIFIEEITDSDYMFIHIK